MREIRDIQASEELYKMRYMKKKKEVNILIKAIKDMNKTINKLKKQEEFLNELLDKREEELKETTDNVSCCANSEEESTGVPRGPFTDEEHAERFANEKFEFGSHNPACVNHSQQDSSKALPLKTGLKPAGITDNKDCTNHHSQKSAESGETSDGTPSERGAGFDSQGASDNQNCANSSNIPEGVKQ